MQSVSRESASVVGYCKGNWCHMEMKVLHSPMTKRWYLVTKTRKDGSAKEKVDITETLDAILSPAAAEIERLRGLLIGAGIQP